LDFTAALAARRFDVSLTVREGETLAVLGPNGAGKSTLLEVIAGLVKPDTGRATLDGQVLFDLADRAGTFTPPHARGIALLAQRALLFPHLSVLDNVAFGPRSGGMRASAARETAERWLAEVDASDLIARRPAELSGGQAQRVAVARALAAHPRLLLLDEPMAALDVTVAPALRSTLRRVLKDRSAIIVTHDILDAYMLADRAAVVQEGRIVEFGVTREVLERPRTAFAATLVGLNLLPGILATDGIRLTDGMQLTGGVESGASGRPGVATMSPSAVVLYPVSPERSSNVLSATVTELEPRGDRIRVHTSVATADVAADVHPATIADLALTPGTPVWLEIDPSAVSIYPTNS
jgi:molybdate transport system ATP-binding protein